ncbi:MAG: DUF1080 domain-containing protein [Verrucomicrobia bacterium]|nr:DUF1080 domain-containing protein [Verrucomicrobiota bacterium]
MKTILLALTILASFTFNPALRAEDGWISLFNGKDLAGWKSNDEAPGVFSVENGELKVSGGRAHLFYVGADGAAKFKNFELKAKVKTTPGSNSGIYIHTEFQEKGWPAKGYECQVNATHSDNKKTGGLYAVQDVLNNAPNKDNEWFDYSIKVEGKRITISIDGKVTVDWTEPEGWDPATALKNMPGRKLSEGTIALQGHDPKSTTFYKDIFIKLLP